MGKPLLRIFAFCLVLVSGVSCGSQESHVVLKINGVPKVFTTPKKIYDPKSSTGETVEISPPYFSFRLSVKNESPKEQTLVVTAVRVEVFLNGNKTKVSDMSGEYLPGDCPFETGGGRGSNPCGLFSSNAFASLAAGSELYPIPYMFYVENLPKQEKGGYVYQVALEILGFWSDAPPSQAINQETDRLGETRVRFKTQ